MLYPFLSADSDELSDWLSPRIILDVVEGFLAGCLVGDLSTGVGLGILYGLANSFLGVICYRGIEAFEGQEDRPVIRGVGPAVQEFCVWTSLLLRELLFLKICMLKMAWLDNRVNAVDGAVGMNKGVLLGTVFYAAETYFFREEFSSDNIDRHLRSTREFFFGEGIRNR